MRAVGRTLLVAQPRAGQTLGQFAKALGHQFGQDGFTVDNVVVGRPVPDTGAARNLAQAQGGSALFVQQPAAGIQDALTQIGGFSRGAAAWHGVAKCVIGKVSSSMEVLCQ